jgi:hypothetical protein
MGEWKQGIAGGMLRHPLPQPDERRAGRGQFNRNDLEVVLHKYDGL